MDAPWTPAKLVSHEILRNVLEIAVRHSFTVHRYQTNRQTGRIGLEHHRRQRARRQVLHVGNREIGNGRRVYVGIGVGLKVDANDTDAVERSRLNMIDPAGEREEPLQVIGNIAFNLLGRHPRVKRRHNHYRDVHRREHIHRHLCDTHHSKNRDDRAHHQDQIRSVDCESRHGWFKTWPLNRFAD